MEDLTEFLRMGGYAFYVWSSFGATAVLLAVLWTTSFRSLRARERELERIQARAAGPAKHSAPDAGVGNPHRRA